MCTWEEVGSFCTAILDPPQESLWFLKTLVDAKGNNPATIRLPLEPGSSRESLQTSLDGVFRELVRSQGPQGRCPPEDAIGDARRHRDCVTSFKKL